MEKIIRVNNEPDYAKKYEFEVCRVVNGEYWFFSAYTNGHRADQIAKELNQLGNEVVILHNVRIQGMK